MLSAPMPDPPELVSLSRFARLPEQIELALIPRLP